MVRRGTWVALTVLLSCALMAWVEVGLSPIYPVKSAIKVALFLGGVGLYVRATGDRTPLSVFRRPARSDLRPALMLCALVLAGILGGYALLSPWLDLSAIPDRLAGKEGITAATFPIAALYIALGNSMVEELFFRGFAFLTLRGTGWKTGAWLFSALAFALYHVAIMGSWFHPVVFLLLTAALAVAGLLFNWLDRNGTLWPAWVVHMGANVAINSIAMYLLMG